MVTEHVNVITHLLGGQISERVFSCSGCLVAYIAAMTPPMDSPKRWNLFRPMARVNCTSRWRERHGQREFDTWRERHGGDKRRETDGGDRLRATHGGDRLRATHGGDRLRGIHGGDGLRVIHGGDGLRVIHGGDGLRVIHGGDRLSDTWRRQIE